VPRAVLRLVACALSAAAVACLPVLASPAAAASRLVGGVDYVYQVSPTQLKVSGWMVDLSAPGSSLDVNLRVDGVWRRTVATTVYRQAINAKYHASGNHGFVAYLSFLGGEPSGSFLGVRGPDGSYVTGNWITTMGRRILDHAAEYVGAPYKYGGASPSGFDCSGYTLYVYGSVDAGTLVHSADGQRQQVHPVPASELRPGDLIFYMSGSSSYHVAIYSGGGTGLYQGWEYAAATPQAGVVHEHIWSQSIRFGTTWHWT
jgi:cell wall-associated NlpC family hydrolase